MPPQPKRKRVDPDENPPAKKRARRAAKKIDPESGSDSSVQVVVLPKKRRIGKGADTKDAKPKKAKRVETPPNVSGESDDEDASDVVPARKARRNIEIASDSDEDERPKRLRRAKLEKDSDDESDSPQKGRLQRKSEHVLDSDDDPEDLALPAAPTSSQPTRKELKSNALARYAKARKNKSSPAPVPSDAGHENEEEEEEDEGEDDGSEDLDQAEEGFIVEENEQDADDDANAALDIMRYSQRELDEHFTVFVEYIIALHSDPGYLSTATEQEKQYFETAVIALKRHINPLADSIVHSHWKAPFMATLDLRPSLKDGLVCDGSGNCHACWTRGKFSCDLSSSYELSTNKGIYDHSTFQDLPEKKIKYSRQTSFENNAEARNLPYPPGFTLVIGARCFNRALAYHAARHYLYHIAVQVREKIKSLCEDDPELGDDPNAVFKKMKDEEFLTYKLWGRFKSDKKTWDHWAKRKDHDSLGIASPAEAVVSCPYEQNVDKDLAR
ncbi:hypothetical protein FB45DRAFT_1118682 [Roridomyces roridus]|uniref:DUF4211 domain-containing protein n=1 Tax=Roridomyces roridus TaxID=1738132 RepID=A0AAD7B6N9_9AGAR|nr:hypothetical protein FB45DRAFT_1118682 [Roridomyces roridus]